MANISNMSRKEQILEVLRENKGEWVDGTRLASPEVGGSEGLRRLRELRTDGYSIQQRRHPDPERGIWQYRLIDRAEVSPLREDSHQNPRLEFGVSRFCGLCDGAGKRHGAPCQGCDGRGWM